MIWELKISKVFHIYPNYPLFLSLNSFLTTYASHQVHPHDVGHAQTLLSLPQMNKVPDITSAELK